MRHWRGRVAAFLAGLLLGGWLIATPAAQSYVWGAINGIPYGPGLVLSGPLLLPDGTAAAPSAAFANYPTVGFYTSGGSVALSLGNADRAVFASYGLSLTPLSRTGSSATSAFTLAQAWSTAGAPVGVSWDFTTTAYDPASLLFRIRSGAALGTTAFSVSPAGLAAAVAVGTSGSNGQIAAVRQATAAITCSSGATCTSSNLIPAGSLVVGIDTRVTTLITGATSYSIGDGTDADRWGTGIAVAAGTTSGIANFTIASPVYYAAATNVVLTAAGSDFTAGVIRITVHYISITSATS